MGDSGSMHLERVLGFPGQQFGLTGRWVAAPNQAAMRRLPAVPPFRGNERQLSSVANATFRPVAA